MLGFEYLIVLHILKTTKNIQNHPNPPKSSLLCRHVIFCRARAAFDLAEICLNLAQRDGCCSIFQIWMIHFLPSAAGSGHLTSFWSLSRTILLFPPINSCWSKAPQEQVHIFVTSIYICLGWESRPKGVHVLLAVTRWAITTKIPVCFVKIYDCKVQPLSVLAWELNDMKFVS